MPKVSGLFTMILMEICLLVFLVVEKGSLSTPELDVSEETHINDSEHRGGFARRNLVEKDLSLEGGAKRRE
jgi:hypothetical protein